jgi:hypothetical protein
MRKQREIDEREEQERRRIMTEGFQREQEKYKQELERKAMEVFEE